MKPDSLTCEEAVRLIATFIDRELGESEAAQVHEHIEHCKTCYSRVEFEQKLKSQLTSLRTAAVSTDLAERIRGILHNYESESEA